MTWTYTDPQTNTRDQVRYLAGQTSTADAELTSDEEIAWVLTSEGNTYLAAALVCEALASRYATRAVEKKIGAMTISYGGRSVDRGQAFLTKAVALRRRAALGSVAPFSGGVSVADKQTRTLDGDRPETAFAKGMDDRPGTDGHTSAFSS